MNLGAKGEWNKVHLVKKEMKTYRIHAMCECGGEFKLDDTELFNSMFFGEGLKHTCDKCGKEIVLSEYYPIDVREEE